MFPRCQQLVHVRSELCVLRRDSRATDDTSLVDLYANRGNADPMLVACALDGIREADDGLFGWEWIIVSNHNAVGRTAAEFGIETLLSDQFATVLDREK